MKTNSRAKAKVTIRKTEEKADGYTYTTFLCRWREDGRDRKKRFKDLVKAEAFALTKEVELGNSNAQFHNVVTRMTMEQVHEAEAAFQALGNRYTLREAVNFFLKHYSRPDFIISIDDAVRQFLEGKERDGVRPRSIKQLESSLRQFEAFAYEHRLDAAGRTTMEAARAKLSKDKQAMPEEIARRMNAEHRAAFRIAAREVGEESAKAVPAIMAKLGKAERNEAARARDDIELNRTPHLWEIVNAVRDELPSPQVHDVNNSLIESFLRSLKAKDGVSPASRKTWNNFRADIHSFCAWCGDAQRRWIGDNPATPIQKYKVSRGVPDSLSVAQSEALMQHVATFEGGKLVHYFALALFAGLRTGEDGELHKLAKHPDKAKLIDLKNDVIHVQPEISKTGHYRQVKIRPNLRRWLLDYPAAILPVNHSRLVKAVRAKFQLSHDVLRHTFFSMYIAAFNSIGRAALEGGNTEGIIRRHYLNLSNMDEGKRFWEIEPPKGKKIINIA